MCFSNLDRFSPAKLFYQLSVKTIWKWEIKCPALLRMPLPTTKRCTIFSSPLTIFHQAWTLLKFMRLSHWVDIIPTRSQTPIHPYTSSDSTPCTIRMAFSVMKRPTIQDLIKFATFSPTQIIWLWRLIKRQLCPWEFCLGSIGLLIMSHYAGTIFRPPISNWCSPGKSNQSTCKPNWYLVQIYVASSYSVPRLILDHMVVEQLIFLQCFLQPLVLETIVILALFNCLTKMERAPGLISRSGSTSFSTPSTVSNSADGKDLIFSRNSDSILIGSTQSITSRKRAPSPNSPSC